MHCHSTNNGVTNQRALLFSRFVSDQWLKCRSVTAEAAAMKCTQHQCKPSPGVCASCLRERLSTLLDSRNGLSCHSHSRPSPDESPPPTAFFPRSVSPNLPHRPSGASHPHDLRFSSTPHVGPTFGGGILGCRPRSSARFAFLKVLLRLPRSDKVGRDSGSSGAGPGSWFSSRIHRKKVERPKFSSSTESEAPQGQGRRPCRTVERGLSPAEEEEVPGASESSNGWRRSPLTHLRRTFVRRHSRRHRRNISGFGVWMSPLVGAGTGGLHNQGAEGAGFSVDLRKPASRVSRHRHFHAGSGSLGLDSSRSRKLADFGRFQ